MHEYTHAAFTGDHDKAYAIPKSLEPVRQTLKPTRPEKITSPSKILARVVRPSGRPSAPTHVTIDGAGKGRGRIISSSKNSDGLRFESYGLALT